MKSIKSLFFGFLLMLGLGIGVAACGGGNTNVALPPSGPTPYPTQTPFVPVTPTPSPTPPVIPTQAAFSVSAAAPVTLQTAPPGGTTPPPVVVVAPTAAGFAGTVTMPIASVPAGTTVAVTSQNTQPAYAGGASVPALSVARSPQLLLRVPQTLTRLPATGGRLPLQNAPITPILYDAIAFSNTVTQAPAPSFSFTVPNGTIVSNASYYLALFDPLRQTLGWQLGFEGPATVTGTSTLTFTAPTGSSLTFSAGIPEVFGLYAITSSVPAPTPAPSTAPAPPTPNPSAPPPTPFPSATPLPYFAGSIGISSGSGTYSLPIPSSGIAPTFTLAGASSAASFTNVVASSGPAPLLPVYTVGTPQGYIQFQAATTVSFAGTQGFAIAFPPGQAPPAPTAGHNYYLAGYNSTQYSTYGYFNQILTGTYSTNGSTGYTTISFSYSCTTGSPCTFTPNTVYGIVFYYQ